MPVVTDPSVTTLHCAVIGDPISHSKSPQLHLAAYRELGLENAAYERIRIPAGGLLREWGSGRLAGLNGLSVTMPHKQDAALLATRLSPRVELLGAANTLVVREDELFAENTDVDGIVRALTLGRDQAPTWGQPESDRVEIGTIMIIGGGGTAMAALAAATELSARRVVVALRSPGKASEGEPSLAGVAEALGLDTSVISFDEVEAVLREGVDAVISTLPPRAADPFAAQWARAAASSRPMLLDVAYDPWPSALATAWEAAGGMVIGGLSMLLHQAVEQVKMFSGVTEADWGQVTNVMCDAVGLPHPRT